MKFEVNFYEKDNGEQPAKEFILSLDKNMIAKMLDTIKLLQDNLENHIQSTLMMEYLS